MPDSALIEQYALQLLDLMPPGRAISREQGTNVEDWARAIAVEFARIHESVDFLAAEAYPGDATEAGLLTDWESAVGLPDECSYVNTDEANRQRAIRERFAVSYSQSDTGLKQLASDRGYTVTFDIWPVWRVGMIGVGTMPLWGHEWYYALNVNYTPQAVDLDQALECAFQKHIHLHTVVHFNLTSPFFETHPR